MDLRITDEQRAQLAYYAHMTPADMRQAWVTPRMPSSGGTILHRMIEELVLLEKEDQPPTLWRYRTGKRGGVRR